MEKLDGKSLDITQENIKKLKQLFPEVVTEGKIDFDKLKLILGEEIETAKEKYEFTWHGKAQALKLAQTPSTGTLRPDKASSKNWDTTKNLYIEGDNLEVLKLLQKSYFGKVKMIYIDPPYNTGNDFVYKDDFRDSIKNYKEVTEQVTKSNTESNGRYHTDWLNMMYPRLKLARNLLAENGAIFVSIDENEFANLKSLLNEVFGEDNFLTALSIKQRHEDRILKGDKDFHEVVEYCLIYRKSSSYKQFKKKKDNSSIEEYVYSITELEPPAEVIEMGNKKVEVFTPAQYRLEKLPASKKNLKRISIRGSLKEGNSSGRFYMKYLDGIPDHYGWLYKVPDMGNDRYPYRYFMRPLSEKITNGVYFQGVPLDKADFIEVPYANFIDMVDTFNNVGYEGDVPFRNGKKPIKFLQHLFTLAGLENDKNGIVLDFFSGSASTAHALMDFNLKDNGRRKFIMVQLPELTDEKSEAYKAGYKNICEIGKERIRRAGDKIVEETGKTDLDIGFKVFKLDSSNVKTWDPETANLEQDLFELQDNIKFDRTQEDLLYEILLKIGIPLTIPIEEVKVNEKTIYNVGFGSVLLCLENEIDLDLVYKIIELKPEDFDSKVIFKETGFLNDSVKTNAIQTLKKNGITDVRSV
ncbi:MULTISPECIES: site-specific DNA-methyltransferase [Heyndrickxia]|jgi:adenine-specific DNA-methyltransferase|nr:site-specific DNA-methyltransferase [Heyndrickxia coagulans]AJH78821.1 DNA methylase family protein [Heyndrickxia coagulans DSM 1 = ATCC 7050]MBF8418084.1 site-specific DNA-methyltransferase [Heyndrickxia coagulans]MCR2847036.1 site-specific DNA-methyltransferase [Heyndrickxia coagulans]MDR4224743.1 site-specific DNA-methyltransferase [Heyndrickxia coagulans DSM 1 = ATCC 7050]MED4493802.1 site-specific DNA-methyltransferase [Heyndrickxia coagulans]